MTVGGNLLDYPFDIYTPTAGLTTAKMVINGILSTHATHCIISDIKYFYLNTVMERYEYMHIHISIIPQEIVDQYNLLDLVDDNGWVYIEIQKGMYGFPQSGIIANKQLTKQLALFGYRPTLHTPGLWKHDNPPLFFTLVVDDFLIKYEDIAHATHLLDVLHAEYPITTDWKASLYCGVTIKWD